MADPVQADRLKRDSNTHLPTSREQPDRARG